MNKSLVRQTVLLLLLATLVGCDSQPSSTSSTPPLAGNVQLEIDFVGRQDGISIDVPCEQKMTVLQVLETAQDRGELTFASTGSGATAFVTAIGGLENEGAGGDNWVFRVNQKLGDRGCGVFEVQSGDQVQWRLGKYSPSDAPSD